MCFINLLRLTGDIVEIKKPPRFSTVNTNQQKLIIKIISVNLCNSCLKIVSMNIADNLINLVKFNLTKIIINEKNIISVSVFNDLQYGICSVK